MRSRLFHSRNDHAVRSCKFSRIVANEEERVTLMWRHLALSRFSRSFRPSWNFGLSRSLSRRATLNSCTARARLVVFGHTENKWAELRANGPRVCHERRGYNTLVSSVFWKNTRGDTSAKGNTRRYARNGVAGGNVRSSQSVPECHPACCQNGVKGEASCWGQYS